MHAVLSLASLSVVMVANQGHGLFNGGIKPLLVDAYSGTLREFVP